MDTPTTKRPAPPYIGFSTFKTWLGHLKENVVPERIDKGSMTKVAGSVRAMLPSSLEFLGLSTKDDKPTELLHELVDAHGTDKWPAALKKAVQPSYAPFLTGINLERATTAQIEEAFGEITGSTKRKAVVFFVAAMKEAGVPMSPLLGARRTGTAPRKATPKKPKTSDIATDAEPESKEDALPANFMSEQIRVRQNGLIVVRGSIRLPMDFTTADIEAAKKVLDNLKDLANPNPEED